jgi:hypothetical protein
MKSKEFIPASKPRNPVVRQQQTSGAGAHRDKKKEQKQGYEKHKGQGVSEGSSGEELANEVYAEFERMYPNLARRANDRTVHAAIMDVLNYGGDNDPAALAQDVARAVKRNMQGVAEDKEDFNDIDSLQQKLDFYKKSLEEARRITKAIKYENTHMEIITEIKLLAEKIGLEEKEFNYQIDQVYEAASNLASEIYNLEEPFSDKIRDIEYAIEKLEDERDYPDEKL